mmetsp:Transcript_106003/g.167375  ORF Transcript_106003/g.167375 Transcript_106003/m.167375 type:complete len:255 (-) Transcript_106003:685-1449(-)
MVHTLSRNARSCETTTSATFSMSEVCRYFSNHSVAVQSRWFVGSSSNNTLGCVNNALASAMRMRQPPLNLRVGDRKSSEEKPNPFSRDSARPFMAPMSNIRRRSRISARRSAARPCASGSKSSFSQAAAASRSLASASSNTFRASRPRCPLILLSYAAARRNSSRAFNKVWALRAFVAPTGSPVSLARRHCSSSKSATNSASAETTTSTGLRSSPISSWATSRVTHCAGYPGIRLSAIARKRVDLPQPFLPIKP